VCGAVAAAGGAVVAGPHATLCSKWLQPLLALSWVLTWRGCAARHTRAARPATTPEEVLPKLCRAVGASSVYCQGEVTAEEGAVEQAVACALDKRGAALKVSACLCVCLSVCRSVCLPV
jgi:hypothetical protein